MRARITVRNDGDQPLQRVALQLSSTLKWERIKIDGADAKFAQHPLDSDADHTGLVNEAVVTLPRPLAPKEELKLEVFYSGLVALSAERLERIGAPNLGAERSDWDRVSPDFIGLRGFGNVVLVSGECAACASGVTGRSSLQRSAARNSDSSKPGCA